MITESRRRRDRSRRWGLVAASWVAALLALGGCTSSPPSETRTARPRHSISSSMLKGPTALPGHSTSSSDSTTRPTTATADFTQNLQPAMVVSRIYGATQSLALQRTASLPKSPALGWSYEKPQPGSKVLVITWYQGQGPQCGAAKSISLSESPKQIAISVLASDTVRRISCNAVLDQAHQTIALSSNVGARAIMEPTNTLNQFQNS